MDQLLLQSLGNLATALEEISKALNNKKEPKSATAKALSGGDFTTVLNEINVSIKEIQDNNKKILANQETLLNIAKEKKKENKPELKEKEKVKVNTSDTISDIAESKEGKNKKKEKVKVKANGTDTISDIAKESKEGKNNNIKEGVGNILLIAGAVLALGMAFKIIGDVDFVSVMALSLALPLLAIAFSKIHTTLKEVGFDPKRDSFNFILAISSIAFAITTSSWILSLIAPLNFSKFLTMTIIAVGFAIIAPSIGSFIEAFKGISWSNLVKSVIFFPLILPAIALGIALASWSFQLIRPINMMQFLTALGISAVFTIISFGIRNMLKAFEGMELKDISKSLLFLPLILPAIALGIALASWAFQLIKPISMIQFLTALGISAIFVIVSFGMEKIVKSLNKLDWKDLLKVPAFFTAVSIAIMLSSLIFSEIKAISFSQFLTALGISAVFVVLSFGMQKIVKSIGKMKWGDVFKVPVFFTAISIAIMLSSHILSLNKPITMQQFLTSLGISAVFVVLSFGMQKIVESIGKMKWGDVFKVPVFFTVISIAIMASSHILSLSANIPINKLLNLMMFSASLSISAIAISGTIWVINKLGLKLTDLVKGGIAIIIIATSIMISSQILALGNYNKFPDWKWALGVGLSLLAFIPSILVLGTIAMTGVGFGMIAAGAGTVLLVATTITGTSHILSLGKYGNYPPVSWSASIAISLVAFTLGMVTLGAMIIGTLGMGAVALAAGSLAVLNVASTIVETSKILSKGTYTGGPTKDWAEGVALSLGAFLPLYKMLKTNSILSFFGVKGTGPDDFSKAIKTIVNDIVTTANTFSNANTSFKSPPPKEWAEGVGLAIGAFAPIYAILLKDKKSIFGVSIEEFSEAIKGISTGIIESAKVFANNKVPFEKGNYPSVDWAIGVGASIAAFAPVFKFLGENPLMGRKTMRDSIRIVSDSIKKSSIILSGGDYTKYPKADWIKGTSSSIESFIKIFNKSVWPVNKLEDSKLFISSVSESIKDSSNTLSLGKYDIYPKSDWIKGTTLSIKLFIKMFNRYNMKDNIDYIKSFIYSISDSIRISSITISGGKYDIYPKSDWIKGISSSIKTFIGIFNKATLFKDNVKNIISFISNISEAIKKSSLILASGKYDIYPDMNWVTAVTKTISSYLPVFKLKEINTKNISDLSNSIVTSSMILAQGNYSYIINGEWTNGVSNALIKFDSLSSKLTHSFFYKNVEKSADRLINLSKKMYNNRKYFETNIDPNFMKSLSSNIIDFVQLSSIIEKQKKEESIIKEGLGLDPISRTANGMIKIASAYDVLAKSIRSLSISINLLNLEKLASINSLDNIPTKLNIAKTPNLLNKVDVKTNIVTDKKTGGFFNRLMNSKKSKQDNPTVNTQIITPNNKTESSVNFNGNQKQLDKIIAILTEMNSNVVTIDKFLKDKDENSNLIGNVDL